jgi:hypothetical protein
MTLMAIVLLEVAWIHCNCLYALAWLFKIEQMLNSVDVQRNKILTVCSNLSFWYLVWHNIKFLQELYGE